MEIADTLGFPLKIEIDRSDGKELAYINYPGIESLEYNERGESQLLDFALIEFDAACEISNIGIIHSKLPLIDQVKEQPTMEQAKALCVVWTSMVSLYDEYAANKMIDGTYEFSIIQNKCYIIKEIVDGRSRYRTAFRKQ